MRVLLAADPELPVPPVLYGGIERIVHMLAGGLVGRGHDVALVAHPDSRVPCGLFPYSAASSRGLSRLPDIALTHHVAAERQEPKHRRVHDHPLRPTMTDRRRPLPIRSYTVGRPSGSR